jgi:hypothetical protein
MSVQAPAQTFPPGEGLRDYTHASKTFVSNNFNLLPRAKYLFYVYFNVNLNIPALANLFSGSTPLSTVGYLVKTAQLPSYDIDVSTLNQYNRKRLVQTKINYNPSQIVFNDDNSDLIRNMWYQYYQYYYSDPIYQYGNTPAQAGVPGVLSTPLPVIGGNYNVSDIYAPNRPVEHWGLSGQGYTNPTLSSLASSLLTGPASGQAPFFNDITIYGMSQKTFAQYTMINPLITNWTHDTYDYAAGNQLMSHTMTIRYETVKYYSGDIGGTQPSETVPGFADPAHYDTTRSPIAPPGSTDQVVQNGTLVSVPQGMKQDLQALAVGKNTLQNVIGAVGQGLVPGAAGLLGGALGGITNPGSIAQNLLASFAPALGLGTPQAAQQVQNATGGAFFPTAPGISDPPNPVAPPESAAVGATNDQSDPSSPNYLGV